MLNLKSWGTLLVAAILALPGAAATWMAYGTSEPDTGKDSTTMMWDSAAPPGTARIYFNAIAEELLVGNVNVGATGSRLSQSPELNYAAILGVWTDCNQDGYVGIAESALDEYPSALLSADQAQTICPDGGPNNGGGWVTEFRAIGYNLPPTGTGKYNSQRDPRMIVDNTSMVWGDSGLPDTKIPNGGNTCFVNPPYGTWQTTGSLLDWADCVDGHGVLGALDTVLLGSDQRVAKQDFRTPGADEGNSLGLAYADNGTWNQRGHPLNFAIFGNDDSSRSIVYAQDCAKDGQAKPVGDAMRANRPDFTQVPAPAGGTLAANYDSQATGMDTLARPAGPNPVHAPQPSAAPPGTWGGGNVPGTVNETDAETRAGNNCDHSKDPSDGTFYRDLQEADVHTSAGHSKTQPDGILSFTSQNRGHPPGAPAAVTDGNVDPGTPDCLGLGRTCMGISSGVTGTASVWRTGTFTINNLPNTASISSREGTVAGSGPHYVTWYAHVGPDALAAGAVPGSGAFYGAPLCPLIAPGAPASAGWECDPSHWYTLSNGSPDPVQFAFPHARVGQHYELRDIDCDDGQIVAGVPVYAGNGGISETNCDTH